MSDDNKDIERRFNNFSDRIHFFETNILILKTIKTCLLCLVFIPYQPLIKIFLAERLERKLEFQEG